MKNYVLFNNLDNGMNENIYKRNLPSHKLEPNISNIPLATKYNKFLVDNNYNVNNLSNLPYSTQSNFFPGTSKPHFSGFSTNVDTESILRNQIYTLSKCDYKSWAPSSSSVLYNETVNVNNQMNSLLFKKELFNDFNPNVNNLIGSEMFNNSTRYQLKNL